MAALRGVHRTIAAVTADLERFRFNRAVAHIRELTNLLADFAGDDAGDEGGGGGDDGGRAWVRRFGFEATVVMIGPMMPHLGEELWRALGHDGLLADAPWPVADPALLEEDTVTIAVQVKGKLRGTIEMPRDADRGAVEAAALALEPVRRAADGRPPRRVIVVPNRIVNVVV